MCLKKGSLLPQGRLCCVTHLSCSCGSSDKSSLRNKRGAFLVHDLRRCSLLGWRRCECNGRESGVLVLIWLPTPPLYLGWCGFIIQLNLLGNLLTDTPRSVISASVKLTKIIYDSPDSVSVALLSSF